MAFVYAYQTRTVSEAATNPLNWANTSIAVSIAVSFTLSFLSFLSWSKPIGIFDRYVFSSTTLLALLMYFVAILSASYATVPLGALYQSLPGLYSLMLGFAVFLYVEYAPRGVANALSEIWHFVMQIHVLLCVLVLISNLTAGAGTGRSADSLMSGQLFAGWFLIHPNALGFIAMVAFQHFLFFRDKKQIGTLVCILITGLVFALAQYRTAWIIFFLDLLLVFAANRASRLLPLILFLGIFAAVISQPDLVFEILRRGGSEENLTTLSGRTSIWAYALEFAMKSPWLGYGSYSAVRFDLGLAYRSVFNDMEISNLDSTYLNLLLENGLIGVSIFVLLMASLLIIVTRRGLVGGVSLNVEMMMLVFSLFIKSMVGIIFITFNYTQCYLLFLLVYIVAGKHARVNSQLIGGPHRVFRPSLTKQPDLN
jgi:O-antigen ligase